MAAPDRPLDPASVALNARLYGLLAARPELLRRDTGERIDVAWTDDAPGSLVLLDRVLVVRATELDQLCGYAVLRLSKAAVGPVLDVLGTLDPHRLLGIYFAVPEPRRAHLVRDGVWAYYASRIDAAAVASASAALDDLPDGLVPADMPEEARQDYQRFVRESERMRAGLPHDLSPAEQACVRRRRYSFNNNKET